MEASGPQRYQERSGKEAPWVWASPLLRCASSREALPPFVSVQWLAQVALKGLEFAFPLRSLRPLGSQWIPGFLLTPDRRPSPSRPKISTSGALSFTGRKDRRWGSKSRRPKNSKTGSLLREYWRTAREQRDFLHGEHSEGGAATGHLGALALPQEWYTKVRWFKRPENPKKELHEETLMRRVQRGYEGPWLLAISTAKALIYN